jgi:hypothetical protein
VSTPKKPPADKEREAPKPRVVPGRPSKTAIAGAKELIEKYGLQRLLHGKKDHE